jgi:hypothetical protein
MRPATRPRAAGRIRAPGGGLALIVLVLIVLASCATTSPVLRVASNPLPDDEVGLDDRVVESERDLDAESDDFDARIDAELDGPSDAEIDGPRGDGNRSPRSRRGPRVAAVLAAAYRAAGLAGILPGSFGARARLGGLVPAVSVRTGRDASWHDEDPDIGRGTTLEVRATWRLDRLVFDGRELQVVALEAARRRERRRLATHVIRTYYVWKRSGSRALEAAAELDALTNGWFSEEKQRGASETRTVRDPPLPRENLPGGPPGSKLP